MEVPNRLINEKSPYLLQHAYNPVDWHAWGKEAFDAAKREDKPVFLSIGYSTCHWCHVMAHESFEDGEVAAVLNRDYICVKVDREERPDVDAVYMEVCMALTGSGGWPLTVLMTPEQKPFWAGTYLPKTSAYGRMGLMELLAAVKNQWDSDRKKIISSGEQIVSFLETQAAAGNEASEPEKALLHKAVKSFKRIYDKEWGGFGQAPKFPTPHNLLFLLRISLLEENPSAGEMAEHTLVQMFRGGIFDHLGGGFSRYSTDAQWLVPHFEKMLYDNALLALTYLEAYHIARRPFYRTVAERVLDYVLRELTDRQGGFYCGQDADSDGVEGKYYVFSQQEILRVLGEGEGADFCNFFGVTPQGNFEGSNILNLLENPDYEEAGQAMKVSADRLYSYRLTRTRLHKDDKVLTSWNALMIAAFAKAGWLLDRPDYLQAAKKAQSFLENNLMNEAGKLMLRWREGEAAHDGQLDDYAFYAFALLALYEATYEAGYLQKAAETAGRMLDLFWDEDAGGFFFYSKEGEQLISRPKETADGAIPSGNSVAALVLGRLFKLTGDVKWQSAADRQLRFLAGAVQSFPAGHSMALIAVSEALYPSRELICATSENDAPAELAAFLRAHAIPGLTVLLKTRDNGEALSETAPFTENYPVPENGTLYYLCQNGACAPPSDSLETLTERLR